MQEYFHGKNYNFMSKPYPKITSYCTAKSENNNKPIYHCLKSGVCQGSVGCFISWESLY